MTELDILNKTAHALTEIMPMEETLSLRTKCELPNVGQLETFMQHISGTLFPQYFGTDISVDISSAYAILRDQLKKVECTCNETSTDIAAQFIAHLPEIKELLLTDIAAVTHNDPAAKSCTEAVFCYPGVRAMIYHRTAHQLLKLGIPMLPRIISELAHSTTGIDIHPAAQIGPYFSIDHGTGIVIGETTIIGHHVMLYQGVTLGARNFQYDEEGHPMDIPRHPIIEDNVTIYSNTSVLGRIRIGHDSIIGGNLWVTHDVAPNSRLAQKNSNNNNNQNQITH